MTTGLPQPRDPTAGERILASRHERPVRRVLISGPPAKHLRPPSQPEDKRHGAVVGLPLGSPERRALDAGQLAERVQSVDDRHTIAEGLAGTVVEQRLSLAG